jgi:hypothetical protein
MSNVLEPAVAEIEAHVHASGWDRGTALFALVRSDRFAADEPETAERLGIRADVEALTPIEQDALPDVPLDEALAGIAWPAEVAGCALSQEIVILPPSVEAALGDGDVPLDHPQRREARLVAGVLRDGTSAVLLRLRSADGDNASDADTDADADRALDDVLTGPDLAPNLVAALLATFD